MNNATEISLDSDNLTEILDDAELDSGDIDKIQRLKNTRWGNDFKTRLAQFILGATALMTVNHWGINMPAESWIGSAELPVEQSAEDIRRNDLVIKGGARPPIEPNSIPAELRAKFDGNDTSGEVDEK